MTSLEGTYYDKFCAEKARAERLSALLLDPPPDVQELVIKKLDLVHRSLLDAEKARADCAERKADLYRHERHACASMALTKWAREQKAARLKADAACAEMKALLVDIENECQATTREFIEIGHSDGPYLYGKLRQRLQVIIKSTPCGTGLSSETIKEFIDSEVTDDEGAIVNARDHGEWDRLKYLEGHKAGLLWVKHHVQALAALKDSK